MSRRILGEERGVATLVALLMIGMLLLIGLAALTSSDDEAQIAGNEWREMKSFYAAEAGLEEAVATLTTEYDSTGRPPTQLPDETFTLNECEVEYTTEDQGAAETKVLTTGTMAGLYALVKSFSVQSSATSATEQGQMILSQNFEVALVPIFQFAVFYENDLWATPAEDMTVTGRVHVNGNMYLQANTNLFFAGRVSAAGEIHHGLPGVSSASGGVWFKDANNTYQNMNKSGTWLDASNSDWYNKASARWGGMVQDEAFGQKDLNLPLTDASGDAHKIIERAASNSDSYENKAGLKILDGVAYAYSSGSWQNITSLLPSGTLTTTSFYDAREKKTVTSTDVNISKLKTSSYFPSNGVIYSSDHRSGYPVLRLTNGASLGNPLSVFSENPLYVKGDYNTTDKKPAAVVADAVTYLSNSWTDAKSTGSMSARTTTATTVNVSMITGDLDPSVQSYSGGLANLPRFLENWNTTKFTLKGSMVNLWRTRQASGTWNYGGSSAYYTAPTRDYCFDTDLQDPNKLPPETPVVRTFLRTGWQQEFVSYQGSTAANN
jgi:Tfp pilus assembly protein PilX